MKQTDQTLLEQLQINEFEIEFRKTLFGIGEDDVARLKAAKLVIEPKLDGLIDTFYVLQTSVQEIALLIGDADTLGRLRNAQRTYVRDLFSGLYDLEYVNNRLRIGLVHKRIGVEPKLYLAAIHALKTLLNELLQDVIVDIEVQRATQASLAKLFMFDVALVFETYIRSLVSEIESAKSKSEQYAYALEGKVRDRTKELEALTKTDPLTGLFNRRHLIPALTDCLRAAQRRMEPVALVYLDINAFKEINDTQGHQRGDEVLQAIATAIKAVSRSEDLCFRYGGDEFCCVLPNCRQDQAEEIYIARLNTHVDLLAPGVTLSIGIVQTGPDTYLSPDEFILRGDQEMYASKNAMKPSHGHPASRG